MATPENVRRQRILKRNPEILLENLDIKMKMDPNLLQQEELKQFNVVANNPDGKLKELASRLEAKEIQLKFKPAIKKLLVEKGYDVENGASPMKRAVQRIIEDKLATDIVEGLIKAGDVVQIDAKEGEADLIVKAGAAIK